MSSILEEARQNNKSARRLRRGRAHHRNSIYSTRFCRLAIHHRGLLHRRARQHGGQGLGGTQLHCCNLFVHTKYNIFRLPFLTVHETLPLNVPGELHLYRPVPTSAIPFSKPTSRAPPADVSEGTAYAGTQTPRPAAASSPQQSADQLLGATGARGGCSNRQTRAARDRFKERLHFSWGATWLWLRQRVETRDYYSPPVTNFAHTQH